MRLLRGAVLVLVGVAVGGCGTSSSPTDAETEVDSGDIGTGPTDADLGDTGTMGGNLGDSSFGSGLWTIEFQLPDSDEPDVIELAVAPALGIYRQCASVSGQPYRCGEGQPTATLVGDLLTVTLFNGSFSGEVSEDGRHWSGDGTAEACGGCTFAFTAERAVSGGELTFVPL